MSELAHVPHDRVPLDDTSFDEEVSGAGREASLWRDAGRQLVRNPQFIIGSILLSVFVVMALFPSLFVADGIPSCNGRLAREAPNSEFIFGHDEVGCPFYERVIYGARPSMIIGPIVTIFALAVGLTFGTLAGYYGRFFDSLIARITDIIFALPLILGALVIITALRNVSPDDPDVSFVIGGLLSFFEVVDEFFNIRGIGRLMFTLVILGWTTMLRLARSSVLENKEADYVEAARALGGSDLRIMLKHIVPNSLAPVLVYASLTVGTVIVGEAALSFLGVGLERPAISWGLQLSVAQNFIQAAPHLMLFPGLFLALLVFSFILIGDAVRDALDPKLR